MRYRVPRRLAYVIDDQSFGLPLIYLMSMPGGTPLVLRGSGALIWSLAADGEDDVVSAVASAVGRPLDIVAKDVSDFLEELISRGLLERANPQPGP